ncbi:MAG: alpha/beta fold hydrolase [Acidimicrobiales bacterium]
MERYYVDTAYGPTTVYRDGQGRPLLLLHGALADAQAYWSEVWEPLCDDYDVIVPDIPGISRDDDEHPRSFAGTSRWLLDVLDQLRIGECALVGHGLGAQIATEFAAAHPTRVRQLVLVGAPPTSALPRRMRGALGRSSAMRFIAKEYFGLAQVAPTPADQVDLPDEILTSLRAERPRTLPLVTEILTSEATTSPLGSHSILVITGEADTTRFGSPTALEAATTSLPGRRFECLEGGGHFCQINAPKAFIESLDTFLRRHR